MQNKYLLSECTYKTKYFTVLFVYTQNPTAKSRVPGPEYPGPGWEPGSGRVGTLDTRTDPSHTLGIVMANKLFGEQIYFELNQSKTPLNLIHPEVKGNA